MSRSTVSKIESTWTGRAWYIIKTDGGGGLRDCCQTEARVVQSRRDIWLNHAGVAGQPPECDSYGDHRAPPSSTSPPVDICFDVKFTQPLRPVRIRRVSRRYKSLVQMNEKTLWPTSRRWSLSRWHANPPSCWYDNGSSRIKAPSGGINSRTLNKC